MCLKGRIKVHIEVSGWNKHLYVFNDIKWIDCQKIDQFEHSPGWAKM